VGNDAGEDKGDDGHDGQQHTLVYVSGVAAAVLLVILVFAVIHTSGSSQMHDAPVTFTPATRTTPMTTTRTTTKTTTTKSPPISTTDLNPGSGPPPSPSETAGQLTIPSEPAFSTPTTTVTLTNPYATTSPPNAGRT
jgi:hypothetical protein